MGLPISLVCTLEYETHPESGEDATRRNYINGLSFVSSDMILIELQVEKWKVVCTALFWARSFGILQMSLKWKTIVRNGRLRGLW